jgi:type IV pilus assembly protein PilY1
MWKIDIRGATVSEWGFSYGSAAAPEPLITVRNASGEIQPITSQPVVMLDCLALKEARGLMVLFGTGQYLNKADLEDHTVQSAYGIWDWGPVWEVLEDEATARTKSLGTFQADRSLSNTSYNLLQQEFTNETDMWWTMTDNAPEWYNPKTDTGLHVGWYFDLPESDEGERLFQSPLLRLGSLVLVSTIPSNSPCAAGGRSSMYIVDPCTGGDTGDIQFDVNEDGVLDENDVVDEITGDPTPQGRKILKIVYGPLEMDEKVYLVDPDGNIDSPRVPDIPEGMYFWRTLGD